MNKRRLLALATFLETKVPEEQFNFGVVSADSRGSSVEWLNEPLSVGCGAVGCAVGWAPSMRCFKREGWTFRNGELTDPDGYKKDYLSAASDMFGINISDAEHLFTPVEYSGGSNGLSENATAKDVAAHIRNFVAERK